MNEGSLERSILTVDKPYQKKPSEGNEFKYDAVKLDSAFKGLQSKLPEIKQMFELDFSYKAPTRKRQQSLGALLAAFKRASIIKN